MSDETDEPEITQPEVATEPQPKAPDAAPARPDGQSMGYSSRGAAAPQGQNVGGQVNQPSPVTEGTEQADPGVSVDRAAIAQQAREGRQQMLKDRWNQDYADSKPVPPDGYQILPEEQAALEAQGYKANPRMIAAAAARHEGTAVQQAIQDAESQARQENAASKRERDGRMSSLEQQMRNSGQRYFIDSNRTVQPIKDPATGRPLFNPTAWEQGVNPQTGQPTLTKRDNFGQVQYKTPQIVHNPDLTDDQLYYQFPNGKTVAAGKMDDLTKSPDFGIKRAAIKAVGQRRAAQWKEAIAPMSDLAASADQNQKEASQQILDLQQSTQTAQDEINQLNANPQLNETQGGLLGTGLGAKPSQASLALKSTLAAKEDDLAKQNDQLSKLQDSVKPTGDLGRARRQTQLNLAIFKSQAQHDNYANLADERRAILQAQGKPEASDPTLTAILKAQDSFKANISRFSASAKTEGITTDPGPNAAPSSSQSPQITPPAPAGPTGAHPLNSSAAPLTDDQRIASTGTRLDVGAPIPGVKNAYQSLPAPPHANDPVVDPDNPNAPPPPASKITLSQGDLPPTNAQIAQKFQDVANQAAPAVDALSTAASGIGAIQQQEAQKAQAAADANKPGANQHQEPFALAQQGITHVGNLSVDQLGKRYGTGKGDVTPLSMVKMSQRMSDLASTLSANEKQDWTKMYPTLQTNIDPKLRAGMQQESDYLHSLYNQRMAGFSPADQKRITDYIGSQKSSAVGALARAGGTQALPTYAGVHGFEVGAAIGADLSVGAPGLAKVAIPLVTGTIGALGMSYLANKAQQKVLEKVAPDAAKELGRLQHQDWEQQPFAVFAGNAAASLASFKINPRATFDGLSGISKIARGAEATGAEKAAALHLAQQTGMGVALGVADPLAHGEKPTAGGITSSVAQMLLYGNSRLGTKALVDHLDSRFPDLFWTRSGITAEEFAKSYPDAVREVGRGQGTPEQVDMVQKINAAAKEAGVKVGDLARGRMVAEMMNKQPRATQNALPKSLRPTSTDANGIKFSKPGQEGGQTPEAEPTAPTGETPKGPPPELAAPSPHEAANHTAADDLAEATEQAGKATEQHAEAAEAAGQEKESQVEKAPEEMGPEAKKATPGKLAQVDKAIKDPDTEYRYSVWDRSTVPEGESRVRQVDMLSENAGNADQNHGSANIKLLREKGVDLPEPPESMPPGSYTVDQVKAAIEKEKNQQGEQSDAVPKSGSSEVPVRQASDSGEGVRRENTVDQGATPARQETGAPAKETVRPQTELGAQRVRMKVKRGNGAEVELEMSAREAHKRVSDHLSVLNKLKDCLGK